MYQLAPRFFTRKLSPSSGVRRANWCPGRDLNPHSPCGEKDFKSFASADFATRAIEIKQFTEELPAFTPTLWGNLWGPRFKFNANGRPYATSIIRGCFASCGTNNDT